MAKKKNHEFAESAATPQLITETLEKNFLPYAMSVIISRAIPEIDGFKPSHRKLLYTMYGMGLLTKARTKSANVVGQTMHLNPHGDAAIYETMVRLSRGNESLLHPLVDSKGNFGKVYSRNMAYAASRYTEVKLETIASEFFKDIEYDTVDFVPNYDNSTMEPTLLPAAFPNILVSTNIGIAVGMASNICGFNLKEVCDTTTALIENEDHDISSTLLAPDFPTGGQIINDKRAFEEIYRTGLGSFKVRAKYRIDEKANCIEIYEIPYTTTIEAIVEKITELVKIGKIKDISDIRDESDKNGLKITIDVKRGTDCKMLMDRLYHMTPLMDSFACNFNVLIAGMPRVLGVRDILLEWYAFREECVKRKLFFNLTKMREKLHLLEGLGKILVDIDRAIKIIRETAKEKDVVPNLMEGFTIDQIQAEYIAEIRLRHINREYILNRINEAESLRRDINSTEATLKSRKKVAHLIISELTEISKKYGKPRMTEIIDPEEVTEKKDLVEQIADYPVTFFFTKEGYMKKITPQSLRMWSEQKFKESDELLKSAEGTNKNEILVFTDKGNVYKVHAWDFEDGKASGLGDYLPSVIGFEKDENFLNAVVLRDYGGQLVIVFENGRAVKLPLSVYETKSNRKRLSGGFCTKFRPVLIDILDDKAEIFITTSNGRAATIPVSMITSKETRSSQGAIAFSLAAKAQIKNARVLAQDENAMFRARKLPTKGTPIKADDTQLSLE